MAKTRTKPQASSSKRKPVSKKSALDPALVKALSHPMRMRILTRLNDVVASPKELADEFGVSLPMLSYHFRVLANVGAIKLVSKTQVRGAIEHHYEATTRAFFSDADWARLPANDRQGVSKMVVDQILADLSSAFAAATFDARDDRHLSFTPLVLDEKGWADLQGLLAPLLDRAAKIQTQSKARLKSNQRGGGNVSGRLAILLYEGAVGDHSADIEDDGATGKAKRGRR